MLIGSNPAEESKYEVIYESDQLFAQILSILYYKLMLKFTEGQLTKLYSHGVTLTAWCPSCRLRQANWCPSLQSGQYQYKQVTG